MRAVTAFALGLLAAAGAAAGQPEAAAHGEGGAISPFAGDFGNALWTLVVFAVLLWVLGRYAWGPVLRGLQGREQFIRAALEEAKRDRDQAEERLKEYAAKLAGGGAGRREEAQGEGGDRSHGPPRGSPRAGRR